MKTIRIAITLLVGATLILSSCIKEEMGSEPMTFDRNELAFTIGSVATKAVTLPEYKVLDIATVKPGDGSTLFLQDEVTSLDDARGSSLRTKGTPAYTENVLSLYGTFNTVALLENGSQAFSEQDVTFTHKQDNVWQYLYRDDIWEDSKFPTYFFMRMPGDMTSNGVTLAKDPYNVSDGSISFHYVSPGTGAEDGSAVAQQDILFTSHKRTEKVNGEAITFYHALTGVKFANHFRNNTAIDDNKTETIIKKVVVSGLKNEGDCVVTPLSGIEHPSVGNSKDAVVWDEDALKGSATFTQTFKEAFAEYDSTYNLDEKLNEDAAARNLNEADGSRTFWFIPQTLNSNVKIKVLFDIRVNEEYTFKDQELEVSLGDALADGHKTWKAGELHTFTLRPEKVGVKIEDDLNSDVKSNVRITNTGNVDQYVRVYIIGNWFGERQIADGVYNDYESILMGYTTETGTEEVARWNDKDFTWSGGVVDGEKVYEKWASPAYPQGYDYTPFGEFVGLPEKGTKNAPGKPNITNTENPLRTWVRHDKFYYYKELIGPGDDLPSTAPLFTKYTVGNSPTFWIADMSGVRRKARKVHLVMDISVQAIPVPYNDDGPIGYEDAWKAALGVDNINDL